MAASSADPRTRVRTLLGLALRSDNPRTLDALPDTDASLQALQAMLEAAEAAQDAQAVQLLTPTVVKRTARRRVDAVLQAIAAAREGVWEPLDALPAGLPVTEDLLAALVRALEAGDADSAAVIEAALVARVVRRAGGPLGQSPTREAAFDAIVRVDAEQRPLPLAAQPLRLRQEALSQAVQDESVAGVQYALAAGADARAWASQALAMAAATDDTDMMRTLLEAGASPTDALLASITLQQAPSALATLADEGADVNAYGGAALSLTAAMGDADSVRALLDAGASAAAGDSEPLWAALHARRVGEDIVGMLLEGGAQAGARDGAMLVAAARSGNDLAVSDLLELGVPANVGGGAALRAAVAGQHKEIVELLLYAGAAADASDSSALLEAARVSSTPAESSLAIAAMLLDAGAAADTQGGSAVSLAAMHNNYRVLGLLLAPEGGNAAATPLALQIATDRGHLLSTETLLQARADAGVLTAGELQEVLARAALKGHAATVGLLRAWGAVPPNTLAEELGGNGARSVLEALRGAPGFEDGAAA